MSFSANVKAELCRLETGSRAIASAECYGILLYANTFDSAKIKIVTSSEEFANRLKKLFKKAFAVGFDSVEEGKKLTLTIEKPEKLAAVLGAFGYERLGAHHINLGAIEEDGAREAFLRGAFLSGGSVTDPEKSYHLELSTDHYFVGREIGALLQDMGFEPGSVQRGGNYVTYFKSSNVIEDFLTTIGASVSAMEIMQKKIEKDMTNTVNRKVNCDTANVLKTVMASAAQIDAIAKIRERGAFDALPEKLKEAAALREANPEMALSELAREAGISKPGLNHRLKPLIEISDDLGE